MDIMSDFESDLRGSNPLGGANIRSRSEREITRACEALDPGSNPGEIAKCPYSIMAITTVLYSVNRRSTRLKGTNTK